MIVDALVAGLWAGGGAALTSSLVAAARRRAHMSTRRRAEVVDPGALHAARGVVHRWAARRVPARVRVPVVAASAVLTVALGSVLPLLLGAGLVGVPWWVDRRRGRRNAEALEHAVPTLASSISRSLRVGLSLRHSLRAAVGSSPTLALAARRLDAGESPVVVLGGGDPSLLGDDVASLVALLGVGEQVGGRLAESFDSLAASIVDRRDVESEIRALTSQARASTVMLAALPFVSAGLVGLVEPGVWGFLFGTTAGAACLAVAVLLDALAVLWMTALVRGVQ